MISSLESDTESGTSSALGTEEGDVLGLEDVVHWWKIWVDIDVHHLTGEGSVVNLHLVRSNDDEITWDVLTTLNLDKISWNDVLGINLLLLTVSDNVGGWWDEVLELGHHLGRLGGLSI